MSVKERILASATQVFAECGYRDAKIADIVKGADANIAAVNYHFGSKDNLFALVLRDSFATARSTYPLHGNLSDDASAEDLLAAFAESILRCSFDSGSAGDFNRIMSKTVHSQGSPIDLICKEVEVMKIQPLQKILRQFLGESIDESTLTVATLNFMSLATVISKHPFLLERIFQNEATEEAIASFISQQVSTIVTATRTLAQPH